MDDDRFEVRWTPDAHPDAATLAALDAQVFDEPADPTAAELFAHVRGCTRCQADLDAIAGLRDDLRRLAVPPMPEAVSRRLSAAFAAEHRARSAPTHTPAGALVLGLDEARARRARRPPARWIGAAAAAVVVLAAAGIVVGLGTRQQTGGSGTAARMPTSSMSESPPGAGSTAPTPGGSAGSRSGPRTPGELGPNGRTQQGPNSVPVYSRKQLLSASTLQTIVATILGGSGSSAAGGMADPARRAACVSAIGGAGKPVAVQHAIVDGADAYLFVFNRSGTSTSASVDLYVVSPSCGTGGAHELLHTHTGN